MAGSFTLSLIIALILVTSIAFWQSFRLRAAQKKLIEYARESQH